MEIVAEKRIPKPREDILISLCFSEVLHCNVIYKMIHESVEALERHFRFYEIILVVDENLHDSYIPIIEAFKNVRLVVLRPGNNYYRRRVIAAEEAIGDIVIIANFKEVKQFNLITLINSVISTDQLCSPARKSNRNAYGIIASPITALGRAAGFNVKLNSLQTIAFPRLQLNQLLTHNNPEIALRFLPIDSRFVMHSVPIEGGMKIDLSFENLKRRVQLLQKLLVFLAPTLLNFVAIASVLLTILGFIYAFYSTGVWLTRDDIVPGWFTTSIMLSGSAFFIGLSMLGISLGLQQNLRHHDFGIDERVAFEINQSDIFTSVIDELNVEISNEQNNNIRGKS